MRLTMLVFRGLFLLCLFCACSPSRTVSVQSTTVLETAAPEELLSHQTRFLKVIYPLLKEAAVFTEDHKQSFGFTLHDIALYEEIGGPSLISYVRSAENVDRAVRVRYVHPGMPADEVKIRPGDRLLAINGKEIKAMNAREVMTDIQKVARKKAPLALALERDGKVFVCKMEGVSLANVDINLVSDLAINAYVEVSEISLTVGMMRFFEDDSQLATIIAHELGHSLLRHVQKRAAELGAAEVLDLGFPVNLNLFQERHPETDDIVLYPLSYELAADRVALYLLARAGFSVSDAQLAWTRLRNETTSSFRDKHPFGGRRELAMEALVREILFKLDQKHSLVAPAELLVP